MAFGALVAAGISSANSITNPVVVPIATTIDYGDLIYAVCFEQTSLTVTGAFDNLGNTYTALSAGVDATAVTGRAFYSIVTIPGSLTTTNFTATSGTDNYVAIAGVWEGPFEPGIALDKAPAETSDWTTAFSCPASGALATSTELVVAWSVVNNGGTMTATSPNTLATAGVSQAVVSAAMGYQVVSTTTSVVPVFTGTTATNGLQGTSTFRKQSDKPHHPSPFVYQPLIAQ